MSDRAGEALRRAPYACLAATLVVHFLLLSPMSVLARDADEADDTLAVVAAVLIAGAVLTALVLAPRLVYPEAQGHGPNAVALLRWAFAVAPFWIGLGAVAAGAQPWALSVGIVASVMLLVVAARTIGRASG